MSGESRDRPVPSPPQPPGDPDARRPVGERPDVVDAQRLRALTHPIRLALLEALALEGPLTATRAGELIGEPPNSCSFHFRQLARHGFVEPAHSGSGRAHPWRLTSFGMRFSDLSDDPAANAAARGLDRMLRDRYFARLQRFYETRSEYPPQWQRATGGSQFLLHVTPDELRELDEQITALLDRHRERLADPALRPEGTLAVEFLLFAYPVEPPQAS